MTITTKTKTGIEVVLREKNEKVFAELEFNGEKLAGFAFNSFYQSIGWVAEISCMYQGKRQRVKLTIAESDFLKIESIITAKKIERIKAEESVLRVTFGCDSADSVYISGAASLLFSDTLKPFLHDVLLEGYKIPASCERCEASNMSYGGWRAEGEVANEIITKAILKARDSKVAREKWIVEETKRIESMTCPMCHEICCCC